ncbi:MAG: leucine-rich repeat protein, partial [Prevotellaceae bacterium]|nr:leucine-rich repeat protein [Prevotellaceae bacterium]
MIALCAILFAVSANAQVSNTALNGIVYNSNGTGTVEITGRAGGLLPTPYIPSTVSVGGTEYSVTAIADEAFAHNGSITSIHIPTTVTYIGYRAFYSCDNLKTVTFYPHTAGSVANVSTNTSQYAHGDVFGNTWDAGDFTIHLPPGSTIPDWSGTIVYDCYGTLTISVSATDAAMGSVLGGGSIFCVNNSYAITAQANIGYEFSAWNDGNTDNPRHIYLTRDTTFVATFVTATVSFSSHPFPPAAQFYDFDGTGSKGFVFGKNIGEQVQINLHGNSSQNYALQNTLGTFLYKSGIWQGNDKFFVVLEDLNRDGKIDIGLTHGVPNHNADTVLVSNADGSYRFVTGGLIAGGDLNMDGRVDLLENTDGQSDMSSGIVKYLNWQTANGAFNRSSLQAMTYDEYVASQNQADYEAYLAAVQANKRPPRPTFSGVSLPDESAPDLTDTKPTQVLDMNGDDVPDLVIEGSGLVLYGTENQNRYVIGSVGNNVKARDLNGDGFTDFVIWDNDAEQLKTMVYRGDGNYQTTVL